MHVSLVLVGPEMFRLTRQQARHRGSVKEAGMAILPPTPAQTSSLTEAKTLSPPASFKPLALFRV